jgi:hypothetical protein
MVKCWAAVAMMLRVRKKRYWVKIGALLNVEVDDEERSILVQVK